MRFCCILTDKAEKICAHSYYVHQICLWESQYKNFWVAIVCLGALTLPPNTHTHTPTHTLFFAKLSLKAGTIQAPLFRQSLCFIGFCEPLPSKNQIFQWNPIILKVSSLTPYHLLKVNKLLVETSQQFTFLAMTEKHFCL